MVNRREFLNRSVTATLSIGPGSRLLSEQILEDTLLVGSETSGAISSKIAEPRSTGTSRLACKSQVTK